MKTCPGYLEAYRDLWDADPHAANLAWFRDARFGLFLHYGLYSQLGRGEWALYQEAIRPADYEKLFATFVPSRFDAAAIVDVAADAGMRYINLTTCHHEGFCLWNSAVEPFNAVNACGRDLVRELGEACARKGLGFFCYFTYVLNWRHPYALTRDVLEFARPDYPDGEPRYRLTRPEEWTQYWEWSHACVEELCAFDFPIAGIWLDIISAYYRKPELIPVEETYRLIRARRPEALISFKQGATGTEDFAAPEFHFRSQGDILRGQGNEAAARRADTAWAENRNKHNEICMTLQDQGWGWHTRSKHKSADTLWSNLAHAGANRCNLLANTGPLPDGSLHPGDVEVLREVGRRIRERGYPDGGDALPPSASTAAAAE